MPAGRGIPSPPAITGFTPPDPTTEQGDFWFTMPAAAATGASTKKVWTHYFPFFTQSWDNKPEPDYYDVNWLTPQGEYPKYANVGGWFRDRPLRSARPKAGDYVLTDMRQEVEWASTRGFDGWCIDLLGTSGIAHERTLRMCEAVKAVPAFRIILMIDVFAGFAGNIDSCTLAINQYINANPAQIMQYNGGYVVSPFYAEGKTVQFWTDFINLMWSRYGKRISFMPCGLNPSISTFNPISFGFSMWGGRNTNFIGLGNGAQAHGLGKLWMEPVAIQDYRAHQAMYDEAGNTDTLRKSWDVSRQAADWVQVVTWNDWSEHAEIAPSELNKFISLDLQAYFIAWFKTGVAPTITRDCLVLSHRRHALAAPTPGQPTRANLRPGSTPGRDTVECLSFLTTAGTIDLTVGGSTTSYSAPAGMSARTVALATGSVSASISGRVSVTSPYTVLSTSQYQNLKYHFATSET